MSLSKKYVRDGKNRIIGSITSGYSDTSSVVRDGQEQIVGRTSERFNIDVRPVHRPIPLCKQGS